MTTTPRAQTVIVEYHGWNEWWLLLDDGRVQVLRSPAAVIGVVQRAALRGNTTATVTTIEWRDVPAGFVPPTKRAPSRP
jgi:hypothetical protein